MSYTGHVEKGVVVFDGPDKPRDGVTVRIDEVAVEGGPTWGEVFKGLIGSVEGLPADMAENHDHHIHGAPTISKKLALLRS